MVGLVLLLSAQGGGIASRSPVEQTATPVTVAPAIAPTVDEDARPPLPPRRTTAPGGIRLIKSEETRNVRGLVTRKIDYWSDGTADEVEIYYDIYDKVRQTISRRVK